MKKRALQVGVLWLLICGADHAGVNVCWYNPKRKQIKEYQGTEEGLHIKYEIGEE